MPKNVRTIPPSPFPVPHFAWVKGQTRPVHLNLLTEEELEKLCFDFRTSVYKVAGKIPRE